MAEEEDEHQYNNNNILHPNTLISWQTIQSSQSQFQPQSQSQSPIILLQDPHIIKKHQPWSTPSIVFPPTNHENLNLVNQCYVLEKPFDPKDQKVKPLVNPESIGGPVEVKEVEIGGPFDVKMRMKAWFLKMGLSGFVAGLVKSGFGLVRWVNGGVIGGMVLVLLFCLKFRVRRRRRVRGEAIDELLGVIKEKDERINRLLHQIARMNELLLASHHGVPMISKATSS